MRRLASDYESVRARYSGHDHVVVRPLGGQPPTEYEVTYLLKGLTREGDRPRVSGKHVCVIRLGVDYPRSAPFVEAVTPLFHPNVAGHYCVGDVWTPAESIADVIGRIGEMIQWRAFNVNSALNADAALYATAHPELFPLDDVQLTPPDAELAISVNRSPDQANDRVRDRAGATE